jgi:hypothetical protein
MYFLLNDALVGTFHVVERAAALREMRKNEGLVHLLRLSFESFLVALNVFRLPTQGRA